MADLAGSSGHQQDGSTGSAEREQHALNIVLGGCRSLRSRSRARGLGSLLVPSQGANDGKLVEDSMTQEGPVLRVFEARTKTGCIDKLMRKFATTSADVVKGQSGNAGYFFGRCVQGGENVVLFVSVWESMDAVKARFGGEWRSSYLPSGYQELIEDCSIRHFDLDAEWHVDDLS